MKTFLPILATVLCFAVLLFGNLSYNAKVKEIGARESTVAVNRTSNTVNSTETSFRDVKSFIKNWPKASRELFEEKFEANEPFTILFVGSTAIDNGDFRLVDSLETKMGEVFGDSVEIISKTYDMNSTQFIEGNNQAELADLGAHMIIFEPFTYEDNQVGVTTKSLEHLGTIIEDVTAEDENVTFVLQPPPPLYDAVNYPKQVEQLKAFAEEIGIMYLDYWSSFPEQGSEERATYFEEGKTAAVNDEGYALWVDYVKEFLISEE